jgi:hypothetical protein
MLVKLQSMFQGWEDAQHLRVQTVGPPRPFFDQIGPSVGHHRQVGGQLVCPVWASYSSRAAKTSAM